MQVSGEGGVGVVCGGKGGPKPCRSVRRSGPSFRRVESGIERENKILCFDGKKLLLGGMGPCIVHVVVEDKPRNLPLD